MDEALLNAKFSIGLMRNFCELLFIYLFYKLQEVPASFSVMIKNVLTSLEISAFTSTNIFLLTLVHSSKKVQSALFILNWPHGILLQGLRKK